MTPSNMDGTLCEAERIADLLAKEGVECVVIGAIALAAHRYIRFTQDVDLGVNADLEKMRHLVEVLHSHGYNAVFHEPDAEDPLGGVLDITGSFGVVQIVSFEDRFPIVIRDALAGEDIRTSANGTLRVVPIPQLVALKLYAGGFKSLADVIEMLRRNPDANLDVIGQTCHRYRIRGWKKVLDELNQKP